MRVRRNTTSCRPIRTECARRADKFLRPGGVGSAISMMGMRCIVATNIRSVLALLDYIFLGLQVWRRRIDRKMRLAA